MFGCCPEGSSTDLICSKGSSVSGCSEGCTNVFACSVVLCWCQFRFQNHMCVIPEL